MPVNKNPGELRTGPGEKVPAAWTNKVVLAGSGVSGPDNYVGEAGWVGGASLKDLPPYFRALLENGGGLFSHVQSPNNAHAASAISVDQNPSIPLYASNVEQAIDELTGRVPPRPPFLGEWAEWTRFSSIADWGWAKLTDGDLKDRGLLSGTGDNEGADVFPYFWEAPSPTLDNADPEWNEVSSPASDRWFDKIPGMDPDTDWIWNTGSTLTGGGRGAVFAGGFTRDGVGTDDPVVESLRIGERPSALAVAGPGTGLPVRQEVVVSGAIFPADRGVLALVRWPAGDSGGAAEVADFLAQDPLDRVIAAVLLGQGVLGDHCMHYDECGDHVCDGGPGGIFAVGSTDNQYDPFAYPGQASGQYDLDEIHLGLSVIDSQALKAPFDDYTGLGDGKRQQNGTVPGAGQVRLGTDAEADNNETYPFPVQEYGIPILGGRHNAYNPLPGFTGYEGTSGQAEMVGNSVLRTGLGEIPGFLGYRLPYLKDYTPDGLKWTPSGNDPLGSREKARYFYTQTNEAATYRDGTAIGGVLSTAGHYQNPFNEDYWPWQIARFRHMFMLPSAAAVGEKEDIGTYWLIHFKREQDFESFVRDGVMPWDATDGYELYGSQILDTTDFEAQANLVNQETSATVPAPAGPAPTYGYAAESYHNLRSSFLLEPNDPTSMPAFTNAFTFTVGNALGTDEHVTYISGVAYFTPREVDTGASNFALDSLTVDSNAPHGFWDASYRTDSDALTGGSAAPALVSSPNPMFLGLAAFGYGSHPSNGTDLSVTVPTGVPGAGTGELRNFRRHRVEVPYTYLGSNGSGLFTAANGPAEADALSFALTGGAMELEGDDSTPSFSKDATVRAYFRRPLGHAAVDDSTLPFAAADGHGVSVPNGDGDRILLHTTRWDATNLVGSYGNFVQAGAGGPFPSPGFAGHYISGKDVEEKFLDETYRCVSEFDRTGDIASLYTAQAVDALNGPGLQGWVGGPIEFPVRMGIASTSWDDGSWLQQGFHELALDPITPARAGLQVSGLPDMNIPISDQANARFPSAGVLIFPHEDFSDPNIRPLGSGDGGTDFTGAQPDYSTLAPASELNYVRAFDVAWSNDASPESGMEGQPFVVFQFVGVQLQDFAYGAPGPGQLANDGLSIAVKVPGLTTWMDVGRVDGAGPSKQDNALDGAGCQVTGAQTFDYFDESSGMVACQVRCNVGPGVNLFKNIGATGGNYQTGGDPSDEVPVLVKVTMRGGAATYDLENEHNGAAFVGAATAGVSAARRRGLVTMRLVRQSTL